MGVLFFLFYVIVATHLAFAQYNTPVPIYRNVNGIQTFCQLDSWFSANTSLTNFISPTVGADGSIYFIAQGGNQRCVAILAFQQELTQKWETDCLISPDAYSFSAIESIQLIVDDQRHVLYVEAVLVDSFVILAYSSTTGQAMWQRRFDTENFLMDGYFNFAVVPFYDFSRTGDVYVFFANAFMDNYQIQNITFQYNVINHITGNSSLLANVTFLEKPYNFTGVIFPAGVTVNYDDYLDTSNPVLVTSTNGSSYLYMMLEYSTTYRYSYRGYSYSNTAIVYPGLYGFDITTGQLGYYQKIGYDATPSYYLQPAQLFMKDQIMYFSVDLTGTSDLELVGFNYVTNQLLWRYPTTGVIMTYSPEADIAYLLEEGGIFKAIDTAASSQSGNAVVKFSYQLDEDKSQNFQLSIIDANGNWYGTSQPSWSAGTPAIYFVQSNKELIGASQTVNGVALGNNGNFITVDEKSVKVYQTCPSINLSLGRETIATIVVGALTFLFNFVDFVLTRKKGGIGPSDLTSGTKSWKIFLILFQVFTTIVMTIVGAVSQHAVISDLDHLTKLLSDIPSFRDNYVVSQCSPVPGFNLTDLCFCQTAAKGNTGTLDIPDPMCNPNACPARQDYGETAECNTVVQNNCLCNMWFDQWTCGCNYPLDVNDTYCAGTTITVEPTVFQPKVEHAFDSCYSHYHSILNLLWAVFGIHIFVTAVTIILRLRSLNYLGSKDNKGPARKISMLMTLISLITTAALVIASVKTGLEGQVCTRPDTYDTSTIHDSRYIMNLFPGCAVNNQFFQLNLEGQLYDGVKTSLSVIGAKPGFSFLDLLHQIFS